MKELAMLPEIAAITDWITARIELHATLSIVLVIALAWTANRVASRILKRMLSRGSYPQRLGALHPDCADTHLQLVALIGHVAKILPILMIYCGIGMVPHLNSDSVTIIENIAEASIVLTIALALVTTLNLVDIIYRSNPNARHHPIKGYLQIAKIAIYTVAAILVIATLFDRSPLILLSGIGAMAAVLMLIFQDTLLSMVASVQISSSGIIRVGDWIEMPQLHADGAVIDIALHTVKIQNWDLTITTIPTKRLISDTFKNWRGMQEQGGRRIKRALLIDQNSIGFIDEAECLRLRAFSLLDDYLGGKQHELDAWNSKLAERGTSALNARKISNIGTFRSYVAHYLRSRPSLRQDMTVIVRQLQPTPEGLPLEIICFANATAWADYEAIQADIFDHLLAIVPEFGLRLFQRPAGTDMRAQHESNIKADAAPDMHGRPFPMNM
ncbi:MAG TPA: mechanosensitive ion channel family protein [Herbaspirillum sp.]|jgi:miniconductance mechanosensitive channel